jgi:hypothetical protein
LSGIDGLKDKGLSPAKTDKGKRKKN